MLRIHRAAEAGDCEEIKTTYEYDPALLDIKDSGGSTPMHIAMRNGHIDAVRLLHELGSKSLSIPDRAGLFPVHIALAQKLPLDVFDVLCELDRNTLALPTNTGHNAMQYASIKSDKRTVAKLHSLGSHGHFPRKPDGTIRIHSEFYLHETNKAAIYLRRLYFSRSLLENLLYCANERSPQPKK